MSGAIWYNLYNLENMKNVHGGVEPVTLLKATILHGRFSRSLNYTNGIKSCNASQMSTYNRKIFFAQPEPTK